MKCCSRWIPASILLVALAAGDARADNPKFDIRSIPCCQYKPYQAIVWSGTDSLMTIAALAAYCGPILWYSPDEPLVEDTPGLEMRMPTAFPFEETPDAPVVYYRVRSILKRDRGVEDTTPATAADRPST